MNFIFNSRWFTVTIIAFSLSAIIFRIITSSILTLAFGLDILALVLSLYNLNRLNKINKGLNPSLHVSFTNGTLTDKEVEDMYFNIKRVIELSEGKPLITFKPDNLTIIKSNGNYILRTTENGLSYGRLITKMLYNRIKSVIQILSKYKTP